MVLFICITSKILGLEIKTKTIRPSKRMINGNKRRPPHGQEADTMEV
jgi:hypothetical protein